MVEFAMSAFEKNRSHVPGRVRVDLLHVLPLDVLRLVLAAFFPSKGAFHMARTCHQIANLMCDMYSCSSVGALRLKAAIARCSDNVIDRVRLAERAMHVGIRVALRQLGPALVGKAPYPLQLREYPPPPGMVTREEWPTNNAGEPYKCYCFPLEHNMHIVCDNSKPNDSRLLCFRMFRTDCNALLRSDGPQDLDSIEMLSGDTMPSKKTILFGKRAYTWDIMDAERNGTLNHRRPLALVLLTDALA